MKKTAFIGKGELTNQIIQFLQLKQENNSVFFDDKTVHDNKNNFPFNTFLNDDFKDYDFFIGIGYKHLQKKKEILLELIANKRHLPIIKHTTSFVNNSASINQGAIVYPMCNIDKEVKIQSGVILNNSVVVSHNSIIESCVYLSPGVIVSGNVSIGECTFVGSGSVIANNIRIGKNVVIGAGSVITKNIEDGQHIIGNPAKILSTKLNLE